MVYRIVEELRTSDPNIILNSLEEATEFLISDGVTTEETISLLDEHNDPIWAKNRAALVNTMNTVLLEWDSNRQVLTRTREFRDEQLFKDYNVIIYQTFPAMARVVTLISAGNV